MKRTYKNKIKKIFYMLIFLMGLLIFLYPQVSRIYYRVEVTQQVATFDREKEKLSGEVVDARLELAYNFNKSLVNHIEDDPYLNKKYRDGRVEYARMLEIHEQIGHIQIPVIDVDIPMYAGTVEEVLQKGAGHLEGTSLPVGGNSTHSVITAHSGLPTAKLFSDLKKVKIGDKFYVHNIGGTLAYQVDQIKTVDPSDFSNLLIDEGHDYVTLLTCTPIMINTHRLLVRGHRVPYDVSIDTRMIIDNQQAYQYHSIFQILIFIIIFLLLLVFINHRILRKERRRLTKWKGLKENWEAAFAQQETSDMMIEDKGEKAEENTIKNTEKNEVI